MRRIRITSAKNPDNDFIELNDIYGVNIFNNQIDNEKKIFKITKGFLCTQFQNLGIERSVEFLTIKNRDIPVDNKPVFKKYSLTIEILSKYNEYESKYYELLSFIDRNKKDGFRLYYQPDRGLVEKYCLCTLESNSKTEKRQPIVLNLKQNSLWFGEQLTVHSSQTEVQDNLFAFNDDGYGYYSASFKFDENIANDYYCIAFYSGIQQEAEIEIRSYEQVPLNIVVHGYCVNPQIFLYRQGELEPFKKFQVFETIEKNQYLEISSSILETGVWKVTNGKKNDVTGSVNYEYGSPYFYLESGKYSISVKDEYGNECATNVTWQEEYSE